VPIFDPSQYELWGYSLPTDPAGRVRTLSPNTAGHIARILQTMGLDTASFESTVTFPDGMTLHYMGDDVTEGWGYPAPIAARREPPQPGPYRALPDLPERTGLEWTYQPCAGVHDLGRYIFTESHAGALDSTTWAFPVAAAMGWKIDDIPDHDQWCRFKYPSYFMGNSSFVYVIIDIDHFSFGISVSRSRDISNMKRHYADEHFMNEVIHKYVNWVIDDDAYIADMQMCTFQGHLPNGMNRHISTIQALIDEEL